MHQDCDKILFSQSQIAQRIAEISSALNADYAQKTPLVVCALKGASIFFADIIRQLKFCVEIDFVSVSSYGKNAVSSGSVRLGKDVDSAVLGRDIIIVEDIIDSGLTLEFLKKLFESKGANSVKTLTLLDKPSRRQRVIQSDYNCFTAPDEFIVGYGLDYDQKYRNLPYIASLKREIYEKVLG